ncbi:nuclear transport factor 2 family protein [Planomicrobium sp. CPCC 101079]|uniref:nuclear transport factor 2 family protein n=1 Tax=Planomicrobium sp. CPCC 101079 TaxID=2599618 RepID=UPI0011B563AE|nr:nuclear transport factor 2 family protein [Planomicrobium sp. CPCC 101079]TWT04891.1 nuclear transport factor 2 family protein [Planomicrobium sp. CPCC 101079]
MKKMMVIAGLALALAACSDSAAPSVNENTVEDGNSANENNAVDHGIEDESVGFTLGDDGEVVEADVPKEAADEILAAYKEYIDAFNEEDLNRYMNVIASKPDGFDREEDEASLKEAFKAYDTSYKTSNETIVGYEENRAEVFAEIDVLVEEPETDRSTKQSGRQVVVFIKEDGNWKVTSLHFIGNQ